MFQLIDFANEVEHEMRTTIIQAVEVAPGRYGECFNFLVKFLLWVKLFLK